MQFQITRRWMWLPVALGMALLALASATFFGADSAGSPVLSATQEELTIEPLGHFGGWLAAIAPPPTGGDYLYLGEGSGLTVLDISVPAQPRQVGSLPLDGSDVEGIAFSGPTAYLVNGRGLQTVDLSDPIRPTQLGSLPTARWATSLKLSGNLAYVGYGFDGGVDVVNVSDPRNPTVVGAYDAEREARDIQIVGRYAYLASGTDGLTILDLIDPLHPVFVGAYDTPDLALKLEVVDNKAYVADQRGGLQIVDVTDPAHPSFLGAYNPGVAPTCETSR